MMEIYHACDLLGKYAILALHSCLWVSVFCLCHFLKQFCMTRQMAIRVGHVFVIYHVNDVSPKYLAHLLWESHNS